MCKNKIDFLADINKKTDKIKVFNYKDIKI